MTSCAGTDGDHRAYPHTPRIAVRQSIPERLRPFFALTRTRRFGSELRRMALAREDRRPPLHGMRSDRSHVVGGSRG